MANEPTKVELFGQNNSGDPINATVSTGSTISKYTMMVWTTDPRTAAAHSSAGQVFAGIAAEERLSTSSQDRMALIRKGVFDFLASGAIQIGQKVKTGANPNVVVAMDSVADNSSSLAILVGYCLETASEGERVNILLRDS